jgi:hypothetical protein
VTGKAEGSSEKYFQKKALQGYAGGDCIALQSAAKLGLLLVQLAPRHE